MAKVSFVADTIDGKIEQFPQLFFLECDLMKPVGLSEVRNYNGNECIQVMKVFLVYYEGQLFGTRAYKSMDEFIKARKGICFKVFCEILVNGCDMTMNGCSFVYQT